MLDGVEYQIDVTQPARYNEKGEVIDPAHERVTRLTYKGKAVNPNQVFLIATNNYRAYGGGDFSGTGEDFIAFASPDENRTILANYISSQTKALGQVIPKADNNWRLAPIQSDRHLNVTLRLPPLRKRPCLLSSRRSTL